MEEKIKTVKRKREIKKVLKFLICGGTGTLIDGILYFLLSSSLSISLAKFISMFVACVFSFFLNRSWTFQVRGKISIWHILKYIVAQTANIGVNVISNTFMYNALHNRIFAYLIATMLGMTVNFLLQRFFVFTEREEKR